MRDVGAVLRIGVISDTHGLLRPQVEQQLAGVAHIVHGGDIGGPEVMAGRDRACQCDQRERRYR
jgi:predicted phosphodiesterase